MESRKPCCIAHRILNKRLKTSIRVFHHLMGGNQRYLLMFYEGLKESGMTASEISFGLAKTCPCNNGVDVIILNKEE